jgi:putative ABC transport system ATP-binding protein
VTNCIGRVDDGRILLEDDAESRVRPRPSAFRRETIGRVNSTKGFVMQAAIATALSDERVLHRQTGPAVVVARDLTRRYGAGDTAVDALRGVSLEIAEGELTAVMGPSGSGKSTLMHILAGLDQPTGGSVEIAGKDITRLNDDDLTKLRRDHIGFVFQFFNLLPMLSAEENVVLPLSIAGAKPDKAWLAELLEDVGLTDRRSHRPSELSGGQQQRVAIARALVSKPTVLFADEPTGNLDSATSAEILELLRHSVKSRGQTTVMVTHDPRAATIADRILFLADGLVVRELAGASQNEVLAVLNEVQES